MKFFLQLSTLLGLMLTTIGAYADDVADPPAGSPFGPFIFLILLMGVMYLFAWRPQQKKAKQQRNLIQSVVSGDEIMTSGGLLGKVTAVYEDHLMLEIAEGTVVLVSKSATNTAFPKGTMKSIKTK